jgi:hypothetical protein
MMNGQYHAICTRLALKRADSLKRSRTSWPAQNARLSRWAILFLSPATACQQRGGCESCQPGASQMEQL